MATTSTGRRADPPKRVVTSSSSGLPMALSIDVNPAPYNARTRVHEYGGGAVIIDRGRPRHLRQLRRSTPVQRRSGRYAAGHHAGERAALRRLCLRPQSRSPDLRAGGSHGSDTGDPRRGREYHHRHRPRRQRSTSRSSSVATTSTPRHASAPTDSDSPGSPGITPTCRGMAPNCGLATCSPMAHSPTPRWLPAATPSPFSSRSGRPMASSISFPTAMAGGTSTASVTMKPNRSSKWKRSLASRSGFLGCPLTPLSRPDRSSARSRKTVSRISLRLTRKHKTLQVIDTPYTSIGSIQAGPGTVLFRGASATRPGALVQSRSRQRRR